MARLFVQVAFCNEKKGEIHHESPEAVYEMWKELANSLLLGKPLGVSLPGGQSINAHPLMVTAFHEPTDPTAPLEIILSMYKACEHIYQTIEAEEKKTHKGDIVVPQKGLIVPKGAVA